MTSPRLMKAASAALVELNRLHPPAMCFTPENCPTANVVRELEAALLDEFFATIRNKDEAAA